MTKAEVFWGEVRRVQATLTEPVFITSIENPLSGITGGRVFGVDAKLGAQRIVEGTHKLATDSEIEQMRAEQQARTDWCVSQESKKAGKQQLVIDSSLAEKLKIAGVK